MLLDHITYRGPAYEADETIEGLLPGSLKGLLRQINGFVQFGGGFHLRGMCSEPNWHSLCEIMTGENALHKLYENVRETDIPFGQDCVGDQFLLRGNEVIQLYSETGEIEETGLTLKEFLAEIEKDPIEFLAMEPLQQLSEDGMSLQPGKILSVHPPFCTEESSDGVSLKPINFWEQIAFLSDFAKQMNGINDGDAFKIEFVD